MTMDKISAFWKRQPFVAFNIRVMDGRVYKVDHPDFLLRSRDGKTLRFVMEDDRVVGIDVAQITRLETVGAR